MEDYGDEVLLEDWSEPFFSPLGRICAFDAAANKVHPIVSNTFVIDCKGTDEDCHLKQEIDDNTDSSNETEVL